MERSTKFVKLLEALAVAYVMVLSFAAGFATGVSSI